MELVKAFTAQVEKLFVLDGWIWKLSGLALTQIDLTYWSNFINSPHVPPLICFPPLVPLNAKLHMPFVTVKVQFLSWRIQRMVIWYLCEFQTCQLEPLLCINFYVLRLSILHSLLFCLFSLIPCCFGQICNSKLMCKLGLFPQNYSVVSIQSDPLSRRTSCKLLTSLSKPKDVNSILRSCCECP